MGVDQPRDHRQSGQIDSLDARRNCDIRSDSGDVAILNQDNGAVDTDPATHVDDRPSLEGNLRRCRTPRSTTTSSQSTRSVSIGP
jgi:hypothetical protein